MAEYRLKTETVKIEYYVRGMEDGWVVVDSALSVQFRSHSQAKCHGWLHVYSHMAEAVYPAIITTKFEDGETWLPISRNSCIITYPDGQRRPIETEVFLEEYEQC